MLYRVIENLRVRDKRIQAGTVSKLENVSASTIEVLLAKGRVAEVRPPPLAVLPGWGERAAEYEKQGIKDINDMSEAGEGVVDVEDFAEAVLWSSGVYDVPEATPDFMNTAIVYELEDVDNDDMEPTDALVNCIS